MESTGPMTRSRARHSQSPAPASAAKSTARKGRRGKDATPAAEADQVPDVAKVLEFEAQQGDHPSDLAMKDTPVKDAVSVADSPATPDQADPTASPQAIPGLTPIPRLAADTPDASKGLDSFLPTSYMFSPGVGCNSYSVVFPTFQKPTTATAAHETDSPDLAKMFISTPQPADTPVMGLVTGSAAAAQPATVNMQALPTPPDFGTAPETHGPTPTLTASSVASDNPPTVAMDATASSPSLAGSVADTATPLTAAGIGSIASSTPQSAVTPFEQRMAEADRSPSLGPMVNTPPGRKAASGTFGSPVAAAAGADAGGALFASPAVAAAPAAAHLSDTPLLASPAIQPSPAQAAPSATKSTCGTPGTRTPAKSPATGTKAAVEGSPGMLALQDAMQNCVVEGDDDDDLLDEEDMEVEEGGCLEGAGAGLAAALGLEEALSEDAAAPEEAGFVVVGEEVVTDDMEMGEVASPEDAMAADADEDAQMADLAAGLKGLGVAAGTPTPAKTGTPSRTPASATSPSTRTPASTRSVGTPSVGSASASKGKAATARSPASVVTTPASSGSTPGSGSRSSSYSAQATARASARGGSPAAGSSAAGAKGAQMSSPGRTPYPSKADAAAGAAKAHSSRAAAAARLTGLVGPNKAAKYTAAAAAMQQSVAMTKAAGAPASGAAGSSRAVPSRLYAPTASSLAKTQPSSKPKAPAANSSSSSLGDHCPAKADGAEPSAQPRLKSKVVVPSPASRATGAAAAAAEPSLAALRSQHRAALLEQKARKTVSAGRVGLEAGKVTDMTKVRRKAAAEHKSSKAAAQEESLDISALMAVGEEEEDEVEQPRHLASSANKENEVMMDELVGHLGKMNVQVQVHKQGVALRGVAAATGKYKRFDEDDEVVEGAHNSGLAAGGRTVPRNRPTLLRGVPEPKGKHISFVDE